MYKWLKDFVDYGFKNMSNTIVNLRDVGEFVNCLSGSNVMLEKKLFRGGKIESVECFAQVGYPKTLVNLRASSDKIEKDQGLIQYHFPIANSIEKYDTQLGDVRKWLNGVLSTLSRDDIKFPVFIHCTSGKDRTGIVVASVLWLLGISEDIIREEYLLSEGKVSIHSIDMTLKGIKSKINYFNKVSVPQLKNNFLT